MDIIRQNQCIEKIAFNSSEKQHVFNTEFDDCDFSEKELFNIRFNSCKFSKCDFSSIMGFRNCTFSDCEFDDCNFNSLLSAFIKSDFFSTTFKNMKELTFSKCAIECCEFLDIKERVLFYDSELYDCDFISSNPYFHNCGVEKCRKDGNVVNCYFITTDDLIGYKKIIGIIRKKDGTYFEINGIATLRIPKGSIVISPNKEKCRTHHAFVEDIETCDKDDEILVSKYNHGVEKWVSDFDKLFEYYVGREIIIDDFDINNIEECSKGIHFFMTKEEAKTYNFR